MEYLEFLLVQKDIKQTLSSTQCKYNIQTYRESGSEVNFFRQAPAGDRNFFLSGQMEKCGCQKVLVKPFLCSETQAKIISRHGLAGKIFAIDVIRNQTSAEIIF